MEYEEFKNSYARLIEAGGLSQCQRLKLHLEAVWEDVADLDHPWFDALVTRMVKEKKTWENFRLKAKARRKALANAEYRRLVADAKAARRYNTNETALEACLKASGSESLWESVLRLRETKGRAPELGPKFASKPA